MPRLRVIHRPTVNFRANALATAAYQKLVILAVRDMNGDLETGRGTSGGVPPFGAKRRRCLEAKIGAIASTILCGATNSAPRKYHSATAGAPSPTSIENRIPFVEVLL